MKIYKIAEFADNIEDKRGPAVSIGRGIAIISRSYPDVAQFILDALNVFQETGNLDFIMDVQKKVLEMYFDKSPFGVMGYNTNLTLDDPRNQIMGAFRRIKFHRNKGLDKVEWPKTVEELITGLRSFLGKQKAKDDASKQEHEDGIAQGMTEADWEKFETLLRNHDWTYQHSDDHSKWKAGQATWDQIAHLGKYLKVVDIERVTALYNQYKH